MIFLYSYCSKIKTNQDVHFVVYWIFVNWWYTKANNTNKGMNEVNMNLPCSVATCIRRTMYTSFSQMRRGYPVTARKNIPANLPKAVSRFATCLDVTGMVFVAQ